MFSVLKLDQQLRCEREQTAWSLIPTSDNASPVGITPSLLIWSGLHWRCVKSHTSSSTTEHYFAGLINLLFFILLLFEKKQTNCFKGVLMSIPHQHFCKRAPFFLFEINDDSRPIILKMIALSRIIASLVFEVVRNLCFSKSCPFAASKS